MAKQTKKKLSAAQQTELLKTLQTRFEKNMSRHKGLEWAKVLSKLLANDDKLWSLYEMERTDGEPDVVAFDKKSGEYVFYDCAAESPAGPEPTTAIFVLLLQAVAGTNIFPECIS